MPEPPTWPDPGYPEGDPWYEDIGGVAILDGGPPGDGGSGLTERGGCSLGGAPRPMPAVVIVIGLLLLNRRRLGQRRAK